MKQIINASVIIFLSFYLFRDLDDPLTRFLQKIISAFNMIFKKTNTEVILFCTVIVPLLFQPIAAQISKVARVQAKRTHNNLTSAVNYITQDPSKRQAMPTVQNSPAGLLNLTNELIIYIALTLLLLNGINALFGFDIMTYLQLSQTFALAVGIGARDVLMNILYGLVASRDIAVGMFCEYQAGYELVPLTGGRLINSADAPTSRSVQLTTIDEMTLTGAFLLLLPVDLSSQENDNYTRRIFVEYTTLYRRCVIVRKIIEDE